MMNQLKTQSMYDASVKAIEPTQPGIWPSLGVSIVFLVGHPFAEKNSSAILNIKSLDNQHYILMQFQN